MENDRGFDDLFGSLNGDEPPVDSPRSSSADELNAAFIAAATAPVEPLPAEPAPEEPAAAPAAADGSAPMTRRELRERQRALEEAGLADGAAAGAVEEPATPAEIPAFVAPEPVDLPPTEPVDAVDVVETVDAVDAPEEAPAEDLADEPEPEPAITDADLAALAATAVVAPAATETPSRSAGDPQVVPTAPRQQAGRGFPIRLEPAVTTVHRRSLRWLAWFIPLIVVLGGLVGAGAWAWVNHEDKVREILGWEIPNDYTTTGNGVETIVTILPGDIGSDVAITLHEDGVTKTFDAFYDLLLDLEAEGQAPTFQPGNYRLQQEMSAQSALDALLDPANRITNQVVIPEGTNLPDTLSILSQQTGIPLEEFQAQAANFAQFGLPANAVSLEGYLYPASYDLDGTETAVSLLQRLVTEMFSRLDALGVPPEDRNSFLTLASIVQKESGPNPEDPPKIARVFLNRIDAGMNLESDATVTYGTCVWGPTQGRTPPDTCGTVWLNQADIDDTTNPYNTRALPGLPPGPIAMPGQAALDAVANPADGPWLFFVAVNLATGETVFSETIEEHDAAVDQLYAWCEESDEHASYCS